MNKEVTVSPRLDDMREMARAIAASKMFGVENEDQALALMLLCQAEGLHPVMALRRYHIIDGRPAFRADALQGEFEKDGAILWHRRDEKECAATFFRDGKHSDQKIKRAVARYNMLKAGEDASALAYPGEITIIRTIEDAVEKKVALRWDKSANKWIMKHNWQQSPRQMLHARCLTEGVRAINPGLVAGVYTEDEIIDIPHEEHGESMAVIERNVRQATENAVSSGVDAKVEETGVEAPPAPNEVTADNYKEVVVHIGKAQGEMLGKKVGELHPNIIEWLYTKWRDKLSPFSDPQDLRLKDAVEFAYNARNQASPPIATPKTPEPSQDSPNTTKRDTGHPESTEKAELVRQLLDKMSDLILTEQQAIGIYREQGLMEEQTRFDQLPLSMLRFMLRDDMLKLFKECVEDRNKPPKPEGGPPTKKGRKR